MNPADFMELFRGYPKAYGTGRGGWIHQPPTRSVFENHLEGKGYGIGIGPLLEDGTCYFAAIDIDRPDFDLARDLMELLPGVTWLERSRSGNAHVLAFFKSPIEAWVVRGIMREALAAVGERAVEVFPKSDQLAVDSVGSYLNLPYFGDTRPVIGWQDDEGYKGEVIGGQSPLGYKETTLPADRWALLALANRNDPRDWRARARWLAIPSPAERKASSRQFGTAPVLHRCAEYIIRNRESNPVLAGHRASVYFALAKQLTNWSECDHEEALQMMELVNDASPDRIEPSELRRILGNAERGEFSSTGCDDPLCLRYSDPDCPIVKGA